MSPLGPTSVGRLSDNKPSIWDLSICFYKTNKTNFLSFIIHYFNQYNLGPDPDAPTISAQWVPEPNLLPSIFVFTKTPCWNVCIIVGFREASCKKSFGILASFWTPPPQKKKKAFFFLGEGGGGECRECIMYPFHPQIKLKHRPSALNIRQL